MNNERLVLQAGEAAKILGLSRNSVYQGMQTGEITHIKTGQRRLTPRLALERMLAEGNKSKRIYGEQG